MTEGLHLREDGHSLHELPSASSLRRFSSGLQANMRLPRPIHHSSLEPGLAEKRIQLKASLLQMESSSRAERFVDFLLQGNFESRSSNKSKDIHSTHCVTELSTLHSFFQSPRLSGLRNSRRGKDENLIQRRNLHLTNDLQTFRHRRRFKKMAWNLKF